MSQIRRRAQSKGGRYVPLRMKERGSQLEVFISNLPKLLDHLLYGPQKPQLLVPLPPSFRDVTEQARGVDRIEVFEQVEVGWGLVARRYADLNHWSRDGHRRESREIGG